MDNSTVYISNREDGNLSFKWGSEENVLKNREIFLKSRGVSMHDSICMSVLDKAEIVEVNVSQKGKGMFTGNDALEADAIVTKGKGLWLMLLTADCMPIIVYDPVQEVIGLVRSGWKSTNLEISKKIITYFVERFGSVSENILVSIGPSIKQRSYRFKDPVQKSLFAWRPYLLDLNDGSWGIDIVSYSKQQFLESGVLESNITVSPIDTASNSNYFSHYRDSHLGKKDEGRFATLCSIN